MARSRGDTFDKLKKSGKPVRWLEQDFEGTKFAPRQNELPAPEVAIDAEPYVCLIVNAAWVSHILGVLETLEQADAWQGDMTERDRATNEVRRLMLNLMTGDSCVFDPCCPETNELLTAIYNLNQTIITNQTTMITQTDTQIINYYNQQYQNILQQNYETKILNQMLYDGTPQSVGEDVPQINWNRNTAEDTDEELAALESALCEAIIRYIRWQIYIYGIQAAIATAIVAAVAGAATILTAGAGAPVGFVATTAAGAVSLGFTAVLNDPNAQRKVACCIFDNLKDTDISHASFTASMSACSFEGDTNAQFLADQLENCSLLEDNYLAFLRELSDAQLTGNRNNCDCCNDIADYELVPLNDCTITRVNDFQWRLQQPNHVHGAGDPFCTDGYEYYHAIFAEAQGRCIDVIGASAAMAGYTQTDCEGNMVSGAGGGGGSGTYFDFYTKACPPTDTPLDITITIACPVLGLQGG